MANGGEVLRTEIEPYIGVMNANVLDHFLADTAAIPPEWKIQIHPDYQVTICFHGTQYEDNSCCNRKCVRTLSWSDFTGSWKSGISYTDMFFHDFTPTAMMP